MPPASDRAREDFEQARKEAALHDILDHLRRKSTDLVSFDDIQGRFGTAPNLQEDARSIPLDAVIGSVGRYNDFNRDFLPRSRSDMDRWASVMQARQAQITLPPIKVYKLGEIYFVIDGNHRVSVAKRRGETEIRAHVVEIPTRVALTSVDTARDILRKAALNGFLEATLLDEHPDAPDFQTTEPDSFETLRQQIEAVLRSLLESGRADVLLPESARIWYENQYRPVLEVIQRRNLLKNYPDRTETDLYVWLIENSRALSDEFGWGIRVEAVAADLAESKPAAGRLQRMLRSAADPERGTGGWRERQLSLPEGRMFSDVLVVLDPEDPTGPAFRQAQRIAGEEGAHLLGLWVDPAGAGSEAAFADLQEAFERGCAEAAVSGQLARGRGERAEMVRRRARWADLLVLPSRPGAAAGAVLQSLLAGVYIPVWVARGAGGLPSRVLLAYDGSRKAEEALFLAAYMGALWGVDLSVLTVAEQGAVAKVQDQARVYLESFNIEARVLSGRAPVPEAILSAVASEGAGLLAMGSVHTGRLGRSSLGSTLDRLLVESPVPLLVCR